MDRREALKALMSLPATARISVADLKPDDVIVIECDEHLTHDAALRIQADVNKIWPNRKSVVLSSGLKMRIVSGV